MLDVWKKIVAFFSLLFGVAIGWAVLFRTAGRGKDINKRINDNKRETRESVDRTGQAIDRQRSAIERQGSSIDRAIGIAGINKIRTDEDKVREFNSFSRKQLDEKLIDESRAIRERARKFIDNP